MSATWERRAKVDTYQQHLEQINQDIRREKRFMLICNAVMGLLARGALADSSTAERAVKMADDVLAEMERQS